MKSRNKTVQQFLDEIRMIHPEKYNSLLEMRKLVYRVYPETNERIRYGGIMFSFNSEDFGGLFVRQKHISFEFSKGFLMKDPRKVLEGKGKFRRHLKIRINADIKKKDVISFVKQAL